MKYWDLKSDKKTLPQLNF